MSSEEGVIIRVVVTGTGLGLNPQSELTRDVSSDSKGTQPLRWVTPTEHLSPYYKDSNCTSAHRHEGVGSITVF